MLPPTLLSHCPFHFPFIVFLAFNSFIFLPLSLPLYLSPSPSLTVPQELAFNLNCPCKHPLLHPCHPSAKRRLYVSIICLNHTHFISANIIWLNWNYLMNNGIISLAGATRNVGEGQPSASTRGPPSSSARAATLPRPPAMLPPHVVQKGICWYLFCSMTCRV